MSFKRNIHFVLPYSAYLNSAQDAIIAVGSPLSKPSGEAAKNNGVKLIIQMSIVQSTHWDLKRRDLGLWCCML
jgi:hypothetical protein